MASPEPSIVGHAARTMQHVMWRRTLQYVLLATFVAGLVGTSALERPSTASARNGRLVPATGALFGAWIDRDATTSDSYKAMYLGREAEIGRRFDTVNHFYPFFADFPTWKETWDIQLGRIPMISWNGTNTAAIARGDHDALILDRANGVRDLGVDVFMRWFWEMDGGESAAIAISPSNYIAAWNRIRDIFTFVGATNAVWVWCPTSWGFEQGHALPWYPGDSKVDWICADGYNWAPGIAGAEWRAWEDIYRESHDFAVARGKPLMAGEWGALERNTGEKAAWYDAARNTIKTSMPNIAAIVAFDERRWRVDQNKFFDWEIDSSKTSFQAFQRWGRDSYFRTRTPLMLPSISAGDATGWESDSADPIVTIPVTLSAPSPDTVTVAAQTVAVSAASTDFVAVNKTVKFNPGVTRMYVDVKLRADSIDEATEQLHLVLSNPSTTAELGDVTGVVTITDEDPSASGVRVYVSNGSISEGGSYDRTARLTISLNHDSPSTVTVKWTLSSTSAVRLTDWSGTSTGTMSFNPGQNSKTVTVKVHPDWLDEADETVTVTLSNPVGATIGDTSGTLTISDDD